MTFCNKCLNISDYTGYTISDRLRRAGEYCQKGPAGGNDALYEVECGITTLLEKNGCSNCLDGMRAFKMQLESLMK